MLAANFGYQDYFFFVLNVAIVTAYMVTAITLAFSKRVLPPINALFTPFTRIAGVGFFLLASLTRGELAWHAVLQEPYLNLTSASGVPVHVNVFHSLQAIFVWLFVLSAARDLTTLRVKKNESE